MSSEPPERAVRALQDLFELQALAMDRGVHEIRSLLLAGGYAKLLLDETAGPLNALQRQYLQTVVENTRKIKDVLDTLSLAAECRRLEVTRFDVPSLLRDVLATAAPPPGVGWRWNGHASGAVCIVGDRKKLHSALKAILDAGFWSGQGAIEMCPEKLWISIGFRGPFAPDARLLAVQMQGMGSMSNRDSASVQEQGFAESRDLVRMHGGSVSIHCFESGDGEVTIKLPAITHSPVTSGAPNV